MKVQYRSLIVHRANLDDLATDYNLTETSVDNNNDVAVVNTNKIKTSGNTKDYITRNITRVDALDTYDVITKLTDLGNGEVMKSVEVNIDLSENSLTQYKLDNQAEFWYNQAHHQVLDALTVTLESDNSVRADNGVRASADKILVSYDQRGSAAVGDDETRGHLSFSLNVTTTADDNCIVTVEGHWWVNNVMHTKYLAPYAIDDKATRDRQVNNNIYTRDNLLFVEDAELQELTFEVDLEQTANDGIYRVKMPEQPTGTVMKLYIGEKDTGAGAGGFTYSRSETVKSGDDETAYDYYEYNESRLTFNKSLLNTYSRVGTTGWYVEDGEMKSLNSSVPQEKYNMFVNVRNAASDQGSDSVSKSLHLHNLDLKLNYIYRHDGANSQILYPNHKLNVVDNIELEDIQVTVSFEEDGVTYQAQASAADPIVLSTAKSLEGKTLNLSASYEALDGNNTNTKIKYNVKCLPQLMGNVVDPLGDPLLIGGQAVTGVSVNTPPIIRTVTDGNAQIASGVGVPEIKQAHLIRIGSSATGSSSLNMVTNAAVNDALAATGRTGRYVLTGELTLSGGFFTYMLDFTTTTANPVA